MKPLLIEGKTILEVAQILEVAPRTVYYWVKGERTPRLSVAQLRSICDLYSCDLSTLPSVFLGGCAEQKPE